MTLFTVTLIKGQGQTVRVQQSGFYNSLKRFDNLTKLIRNNLSTRTLFIQKKNACYVGIGVIGPRFKVSSKRLGVYRLTKIYCLFAKKQALKRRL